MLIVESWDRWDQRNLGNYNQSTEDNLPGSTLVGSALGSSTLGSSTPEGDDVLGRLQPLEEAPRECLIGLRVARNLRREAAMLEASRRASTRERPTGDAHDGGVRSDWSMTGE